MSFVKPVEILINNAGGSGETEDWATTRPVTWQMGYDRNVLCCRQGHYPPPAKYAGGEMGKDRQHFQPRGVDASIKEAAYSAAKAAMIAMTASLAKAVAMDDITANTVSPGTIHSVSLDGAFRKVAVDQGLAANAPWVEIEQTVLPMFAQVSMGRVGTLEEIADAISFLVSPRASYITGANLRLDGGMWPGV